ncbi:hypothetical protein F5884DRAFT_794048 [Xylogone sp. PMI_703]|nr:hypothetical protein F5884DRAFT_794048 [Xylogone sp. PMI_703]
MSSAMLPVTSKQGEERKVRLPIRPAIAAGKIARFAKRAPEPPTLDMLPREVRDMIYRECILGEVNPKKPAIIAALRTEPNLYKEALIIYYQVNRFKLWIDSYKTIHCLRYEVLNMVRNVKLIFPNVLDIKRWYRGGCATVYFSARLGSLKVDRLFTTLQQLTIRFSDESGMATLLVFMRHNHLPNLKKLVIEDVMNSVTDFADGEKIDEWNEQLGVPAKLLDVPTTPVKTAESWVWFAEGEEPLGTVARSH